MMSVFNSNIWSDMDVDEEESTVNVHRTSENSKRAKEKAAQDEESKKKKVNGVKAEPDETNKGGKKDDDSMDVDKPEKFGGAATGADNDDDHVRDIFFLKKT